MIEMKDVSPSSFMREVIYHFNVMVEFQVPDGRSKASISPIKAPPSSPGTGTIY